MTATRSPLALLGLVAVLSLSACGGGGGGGSTPTPPTPPVAPDSEPDAFTIQPAPNAPRGAPVSSQSVTIRGINTPANVSITGGEYAVNGGAFTSAAGTVANAQSIVVRVNSASNAGGVVEATLTVGTVNAKFVVTSSTDFTPPTATVVFPTAVSRTSSAELIVRGTASDTASTVASVRVNGVEATSTDNFATWTATVPLTAGPNSIVVDAMDSVLNRSAAMPRADVMRNALIGFLEAVAFDAAHNRIIASEAFAGGLLSIDLASGLRTVIPNTITPLSSNVAFDRLVLPSSLALEPDGTHALVLDRSGPAAILRVNLSTGARTVVSGRGFPNSVNPLGNNAMAMSVDFVNGFAYLLTRSPDAILSVNLATGVRTILSDAATPNSVNVLPNPITMGLDSARNRLLIGDQGSNGSGFAVYTVDLATGARDILSSNTKPNGNNPLSYPGDFAIDGNRALVTQHQTGSVFAVDLLTGNRTVHSSGIVPDGFNWFVQPRVLAIDSAGGRAIVSDTQSRSLYAVSLTTGARTIVSANEPSNIGATQYSSSGVALDLNANRIYVTDPLTQSLLAVNLATGDRTLVSSRTEPPFGAAWSYPNAVAIDAPNNRFLVTDLFSPLPAVYAVAFGTGVRSVLSANASQIGPAFNSPLTLAIDSANNRALVTDVGGVIAVNLTDGGRSTFSQPLASPQGIVVDPAGARALVVQVNPPSVMALNLATHAQSMLSTGGNTGTWLPLGIGIDAATRTIVTGDEAFAAVHLVDPVHGARTLVSSPAIPRPNDKLSPRGLAVDASRRIAWATNGLYGIVQVVDLVTGERVFLTR